MQEALLRGGNLFLNTSPTELEAFRTLLEENKSFDVIIDGLNVAYKTKQSATTRERDSVVRSFLLSLYIIKKYISVTVRVQSSNGLREITIITLTVITSVMHLSVR